MKCDICNREPCECRNADEPLDIGFELCYCGNSLPPRHSKYCSKVCKDKSYYLKRHTVKLCSCGVTLPYHRIKYCSKQCVYKAKYARDKDKMILRAKLWDKQNPEKRKVIMQRWRDKNPGISTYYRKHKRHFKPLEVLSYL